jgi:hypothetical protein
MLIETRHQPLTTIINTTRSTNMTTRNDYINRFKLQLDELNSAITEYEAKAQQAGAESKVFWQDSLFKLRQQFNLTHDKFDELKAAGEHSWGQYVAETEKVRDVFLDSFNYFKSHI